MHEIEHRQQKKADVLAAEAEAAAKLERQERMRQARMHKEELAQEQKLLVSPGFLALRVCAVAWCHAVCVVADAPAILAAEAQQWCPRVLSSWKKAALKLLRVQELQPKLESMEASWFRLHAITAADSAEEVVQFWEGTALNGLLCLSQNYLCQQPDQQGEHAQARPPLPLPAWQHD